MQVCCFLMLKILSISEGFVFPDYLKVATAVIVPCGVFSIEQNRHFSTEKKKNPIFSDTLFPFPQLKMHSA